MNSGACFLTEPMNGQRKEYAMYVWRDGFDSSVTGCDVTEFLKWNSKSSPCFTHTWNTNEKREWLWKTCNNPGREIATIFLADVYHKLKNAYNDPTCYSDSVDLIKATLTEGHTKVINLKIYALFAASDINVSERLMIKYVVWYNDHCTNTAAEKFDGVAVNNEAYASIECSELSSKTSYLDHLKEIQNEAKKQQHGTLLTHYSVSWHWGQCHGHPDMITWQGKNSDVLHHMIDIFDSIDVQVGYTIFPQIRDRMLTAGMEYAKTLGKNMYVTVYTNKAEPCQISFFPTDGCRYGGRSESGMFNIFDQFSSYGLGNVQPCIHYFRGIYSSGGHKDWPAHK